MNKSTNQSLEELFAGNGIRQSDTNLNIQDEVQTGEHLTDLSKPNKNSQWPLVFMSIAIIMLLILLALVAGFWFFL